MTLYIALYPDGQMVGRLIGPACDYIPTLDMENAVIFQSLDDARPLAAKHGWQIGILEARLIGKVEQLPRT